MKRKTIKTMLFGAFLLASLASAIFLNSRNLANPNAQKGDFFLEQKTEAEPEKTQTPVLPDVSAVQRIIALAEKLAHLAH